MYDNTALRRLLIELAASHPEHAAVIRAFTPLALARGTMFNRSGELVCSVRQEMYFPPPRG